MIKTMKRDGLRVLGLLALLAPAAIADAGDRPAALELAALSGQTLETPGDAAGGALAPSGTIPVFFVPDSAQLDDSAEQLVTALADRLRRDNTANVTIAGRFEGATEQPGLGAARAAALRQRLAASGIAPTRVRVAPATAEAGRSLDALGAWAARADVTLH